MELDLHPAIAKYFERYSDKEAPFMHLMFKKWSVDKPLLGLKVLHHVPVVPNTLLKIACLISAGADVTVTNPDSFVAPHQEAVLALRDAGIRYVSDMNTLKPEVFDIYFDCGAQLYQALRAPKIGAIELTGSGDKYYCSQTTTFPVISIDRTQTKQLETVFGCAQGVALAMKQLGITNYENKNWLVFGFGKMGRGIAYFCHQNQVNVSVVDIDEHQRIQAEKLSIKAIDPANIKHLEKAVAMSDIVITATGKEHALSPYPSTWFKDKVLANIGVYDEFGPAIPKSDVLNYKRPINFVLDDPTPMPFIDPEFYIHNQVVFMLLQQSLAAGVHLPSAQLDKEIIAKWCKWHGFSQETMSKWFIQF